MQLEKSEFHTNYPEHMGKGYQKEDIIEVLTLPTGFEEDEYVHVHLVNGTWDLIEETGSGYNFIGNYDTLGECALVYADWS